MPRHKTASGNLTRWSAPPVDRVDVAAFVGNRQPVRHGRVFDEQPTSREIGGKPSPNGRLIEKLFPNAGVAALRRQFIRPWQETALDGLYLQPLLADVGIGF